jgi:hypothetical protein
MRAFGTFAILAAVVASTGFYVCSSGQLFGSTASFQPFEDPLANRLSIVDPPARTLAKADAPSQPAAKGEQVTPLYNWVYTVNPPTRNR